jgi:hypothetical protein
MDFFGWQGERRRHSELWQRRTTPPDGKIRDLTAMFFRRIGISSVSHLIPCGHAFADTPYLLCQRLVGQAGMAKHLCRIA